MLGKVGSKVGKLLFGQLKKRLGFGKKGSTTTTAGAASTGAFVGGAAVVEFDGKAYYWPKQHEPWAGMTSTFDTETIFRRINVLCQHREASQSGCCRIKRPHKHCRAVDEGLFFLVKHIILSGTAT